MMFEKQKIIQYISKLKRRNTKVMAWNCSILVRIFVILFMLSTAVSTVQSYSTVVGYYSFIVISIVVATPAPASVPAVAHRFGFELFIANLKAISMNDEKMCVGLCVVFVVFVVLYYYYTY